MKKSLAFSLSLLMACSFLSGQTPADAVREFRNGQIWNGSTFDQQTFWTAGGKFAFKAPSGAAPVDVFDLAGKFVLPPFGDAASLNFDQPFDLDLTIKNHMDEGFFYAAQLYNSQSGRSSVLGQVNNPIGPDVAFGNGIVTCTDGEPSADIESRALMLQNPQTWQGKTDALRKNPILFSDEYWFIDNDEQLAVQWPRMLAMKPDFIQIALRDVENAARKGGVSAEMAKKIVKKAHKAKLRVFASIETTADFRAGLDAGVDGFSNLPGHRWDGKDAADAARYRLTEADAKKAKKKKVFAVPTYIHAQNKLGEPNQSGQFVIDTARARRVKELQRANLLALKTAGAAIAIGSDEIDRTPRSEAVYLTQIGGLTVSDLLKSLCETTPMAIFPNRKIGKIKDGHEANFIVLTGNPLQNFLNTRRVEMTVKSGQVLKNQLKRE